MWSYHLSFNFLPWLGDHHALQLHSGFCCDLLVRHMVFVGNGQKSPIASHLKGADPSLYFCCQGPALTGIKEGGYDERP